MKIINKIISKNLLTIASLVIFTVTIFMISCQNEENIKESFPAVPGNYELSIDIDTTTRWFTLVIPEGYDPSIARPLVLAFHPGNANMAEFINAFKGFIDLAAEEKWLIAFPNGVNRTDNKTGDCLWNAVHCCGLPKFHNVDDVGFTQEIINLLNMEYNIDQNRIYATGRSNGGMLAHRLGAEIGTVFAAIAPIAAAGGGKYNDDFPEEILDPVVPVPVMMLHCLNDVNVKYYGGISSEGTRFDISYAQTAEIWIMNNSCNPGATDTTILEHENGKTWIVEFSTGCFNDAEVIAITSENCGHQIPRIANTGFDGQNAIFQFFKAHSK
jgi:polyhydroxybutyrate depolymerase